MSAITHPDLGAGSGPAQTTSLHGRRLHVPGGSADRPGSGADFDYSESGDLVQASYSGGQVRLGYRVGTRHGNHLEFRWAEVLVSGEARSGSADARVELLADGRLRPHEIWAVSEPGPGGRPAEGIGVAEETRP